MSRIKVTVERVDGYCDLPLQLGNHFFVDDSRLVVPDGQPVCIWALQSMMPIFPILPHRHRLPESHWVRQVSTFCCPDPKGRVQFRLELVDAPAGSDPAEQPESEADSK
jgi:carbon-monoxide dehydrogenase iron sulfur subunit